MSKENIAVENEDITMTKEEKNAEIRKYENDILAGLLEAAGYKTNNEEMVKIQIKRNGLIVLEFRIRPLSEEEYQACKRRHTNYKKNRQLGTRVAESVDAAKYRSDLIYEATVQEDREKIWCNKEAWNRLSVLNPIDLIEVVLKAGEKDAILEKLDEISGYQPSVEEVAKN